ncbi:MAG: type II secretion system protein [Thermomonas sp.]
MATRSIHRRRHLAGFTLMEMLVTLILVSLTTMLMFQMLGSYRIANDRVKVQAGAIDRTALFSGWFRDSVHGLFIANGLTFTGNADTFSGISLNPLYAQAGTPTPVEWRMVKDARQMSIVYAENGRERWRQSFAGGEKIHFAYLDATGKQVDSWPPRLGKRDPVSLPAVVMLVREGDASKSAIAAAVLGPLEPVIRLTPEEEF